MFSIQQILLILTTSPAIITSLTQCELAIIRCCDTQQHNKNLPIRCFERNNCAGLYWYGHKACSPQTVAQARSSLTNSKTKPKKQKPRKLAKPLPKEESPISNIVDTGPPTPCELAIVRCCDARQTTILPFRCLEVNGCPGLYWQGRRTCSRDLVNKTITAVNKRIKKRKKMKEETTADSNI